MKTVAHLSLIYGLIVILGGIMAFAYNDSTISLFAEIFTGIIIFVSAILMIKEKKYAFYTVLILSLLLTIFYGYNFSQTTEFFQGIMAAISIFVAAGQFIRIAKGFSS